MIKGESYFCYSVGDQAKITEGNSANEYNFDLQPWIRGAGGTFIAKGENPVQLKPGCALQSLSYGGSKERPCWNSITLNSPIIGYTSPAIATEITQTEFLPRQGYFGLDLNGGWNNISAEASKYKFCTIYKTYLKITALPASAGTTNEAPLSNYNFDSLGLYYCFPNESDNDDNFIGDMGVDRDGVSMDPIPANITDPLDWRETNSTQTGFTDTASMRRDTRVRFMPLNSPNIVGGGRTILTARWRLKGDKWSNAAEVMNSGGLPVPVGGPTSQNYYGPAYRYQQDTPLQERRPRYHRFYWALGTDMGVSSYRYRYKFKIEMWCNYLCWEPMENIPKFISAVPNLTGNIYRAQEEEQDQMQEDEIPSVPATPVLEQMFTEFARLQERMGKSHSSVQITDK